MTVIATVEVSGTTMKYVGVDTSKIYVYAGSTAAKRCGLVFNPSKDDDTALFKSLAAGFMEALASRAEEEKNPDAKRCFATAMDHLEAAQMFAVKGLFQ